MSLASFVFGKKPKKSKGPNLDEQQATQWRLASDVKTPYGDITYSVDPKTGRMTQNLGLSSGQQGLLTGSEGVSSSANTLAQQLLASMPQGAQSVADSIYNQGASRLDPQFADDLRQLQNRLYGQGIPENSQAWNQAMDSFMRGRTDAYQTLKNNSIVGRDQSLATQSNVATQLGQLGRPADLQAPAINATPLGNTTQQPASTQRSGGIANPLLQLGSSVLGGWAMGGFA